MVAKAKDSNTETTVHKTSSIDTSSHRKFVSSGHRKMEVSSSGHRRTDRIPMHIPTKPKTKRLWFFSFFLFFLFGTVSAFRQLVLVLDICVLLFLRVIRLCLYILTLSFWLSIDVSYLSLFLFLVSST